MSLMAAIYDGDDPDDEITVRRGDALDLDLERDRYRADVERLEVELLASERRSTERLFRAREVEANLHAQAAVIDTARYWAKLIEPNEHLLDGAATDLLRAVRKLNTAADGMSEPLYRYDGPRRTGQIAKLQDDLTCMEELIAAARADYPGLPRLRRHRDELAALLAADDTNHGGAS